MDQLGEPLSGDASVRSGDRHSGDEVLIAGEDVLHIGSTLLQIAKCIGRGSLFGDRWEPAEALDAIAQAFRLLADGERPWTTTPPARWIPASRQVLGDLGAETARVAAELANRPLAPGTIMVAARGLRAILTCLAALLAGAELN